jgi:hypothetical protein
MLAQEATPPMGTAMLSTCDVWNKILTLGVLKWSKVIALFLLFT